MVPPVTEAAKQEVGTPYDSLDGFDNATALIEATPSLSADIDLYVQRRLPDGSWSGDPVRYLTPP